LLPEFELLGKSEKKRGLKLKNCPFEKKKKERKKKKRKNNKK